LTVALNAAAFLALLAAIFVPLERLFPAHAQRVARREWGTDLLFFLGAQLLWTAPVVAALVAVHRRIDDLPLAGLRERVGALPLAVQLVGAVLVSDLCIYWAHRLSHRVPLLWRFHRVHHTAPSLDWLAAYREHPLDNLYTRLVENVPLLLLGTPLHLLAGFMVFRGLWAVYIHSNVAWTPGRLAVLVGSSRLHHWHHELALGGRVNFTNLSPLMDVLFGTFHDPGRMPERYGLEPAEDVPHHYVRQLVDPLLPGR
jgi:sterol desaturase/sphingolipid hydroxylase (fatty acid hydroxylase superfamily)